MSAEATQQQADKPHWSDRLEQGWQNFQQSLIWQSIVSLKWYWLITLVLVAASVIVMNMTLSTTARFIDDAVIAQIEPMGPPLQRLIVLFVIGGVVGLALRLAVAWIGIKLEYDLRLWMYRGLHSLDPRRLNSMASGQMITRAMTDLYLLMIFIMFLPVLTIASTYILGRVVWLLMQNIPMTIVATFAIPLNIWIVKRMTSRMWGFSWLSLNRRAEVTTAFDETVRGIRVVKAFGREDAERGKLADVAGRTFGVVMGRTRFLAKYDFFMKLAPMVINVILVLMAARILGAGGITIGVLVIYLESARAFANFAATFDNIISAWMWARSGSGRIYELLGLLDKNVEEQRGGESLPEPSTGVAVEDVSVIFGDYPALRGVSFEAPYGELTVVVGPPRSGRSTLADVIAGTRVPTSGRALLDDVDIATLHPSELRRAIVVASEESFLFNRSVRENLLLGARGEAASDDELMAAVHAAGAEDVVAKLPAGLDTILADRGMNLSGGERQRLALARALVRPARALVLDDALTAVNPAFEVEILRRITEHAPDTAVVCLTRRDAATAAADEVIRLPEPAEGAPPGPEPVDLGPYGVMQDRPYDDRLIDIIRTKVPPDTDRPNVDEQDCNWSDEPPGLVNTLKPLMKPVAIAAALLCGFTAAGLVPPYLFGLVVDALEQRNQARSDTLALALFGVALAFAAFAYFLRIFRTRVEESIVYVLRRRVIHRITRLGIDYYDREAPGYMATRVVNDIDKVGRFVDSAVYKTATTLLQFLIVFVVLLVWSPRIALVSIAAAPILIALSVYFLPIVARAFERMRTETGEVVNRLQEDFMGRSELQSYSMRTRSYETFLAKAWALVRARLWSVFVGGMYANLVQLVMNMAMVALLWVAGMEVLAAAITIGALATFRQYLDQILEPLPDLANVIEEYLETRASILRLREPFEADIHPPEREGAGADREFSLEGEVVFDDVTFTYPGTVRPVLEGVQLGIYPGDMIAIVGPTGAGKSSIAKLVARIYDPDDGTVYVDGHDIREIDHTGYRRRLGYVPQETFLFRGSVKDNIAYGSPGASVEDIETAAREVGAYETIKSVPGGFYGLVDEDGKNLTSAQRQLISLVRAWLVDPDVLILDEATAVLDAKLEEQVIKAVRELGRTTILITHRLHVAAQSDRILVVDAGDIVEEGTHDELMDEDGVYASLWAYGGEVDDVSMKRVGGRGRKTKAAATTRGAGRKPARASGRTSSNGKPAGSRTRGRRTR